MKRIVKFLFVPKTPQALLVSGFVSVILVGAALLSQPFASSGEPHNFIHALFTSASATCVTGLIVVDTGTAFSSCGQMIILLLIQLGGLGVMTFSTLFLFYLRGKFGISSREIIHATLVFYDAVDVGVILKSVFRFAFTLEVLGTTLLTIRFLSDMPFPRALYHALFHAVSAFCNAGFSTFSDSLMAYQSDIYVNLIVMFLIVSGGIGFIVIYELLKLPSRTFYFRNLSLHTRVVLLYTLILIFGGAILLFVLEYDVSMKNFSLFARILASLFQSVTARTAGFNTIDIASVSVVSLFLIIILMFIGASPASCGGGIKTATLAVVVAFIKSKIKDAKNVNIFYNTLSFELVSKAIVIAVFGLVTVVFFTFLVAVVELQDAAFSENSAKFIKIFFEVVSAFGTVGLSAGITAQLSALSHCIITVLMLIGRVGPLTLAIVVAAREHDDIQYAHDNILVG